MKIIVNIIKLLIIKIIPEWVIGELMSVLPKLKDKKIRQKFDDRNLKITRERTDINENFKNLEAMYKELVVIDDN